MYKNTVNVVSQIVNCVSNVYLNFMSTDEHLNFVFSFTFDIIAVLFSGKFNLQNHTNICLYVSNIK